MKRLAKKLIKIFSPLLLAVLRAYWLVFRPKTRGVKVVLVKGDQVLLVKHTYGRGYYLPGGGLKKAELAEDGARREIREELGLELGAVDYLGSLISTVEYKRDHVDAFTARLGEEKIAIDNIEIEEARWFPLGHLPPLGDVSRRIIDMHAASNPTRP